MEDPSHPRSEVKLTGSAFAYLYVEGNLPLFADVETLRWRQLIDCDGDRVGTIEAIAVDEQTGRVEFIEVGRGGFLGFGAERFLVPVTRIVRVEEKSVQIDRPLVGLEGVPGYEPDRLTDPAYCQHVRDWWRPQEPLPGPSD